MNNRDKNALVRYFKRTQDALAAMGEVIEENLDRSFLKLEEAELWLSEIKLILADELGISFEKHNTGEAAHGLDA